ncbi:MAG TPA: hypothetical protein PLF01_04145 [Alphaproteobacteria bacterium]|nr:hypothetical protein [Alphaproteobacteria bacterium]
MTDIKDRLRDTVEKCLKTYEVWDGQKNDADARQNLQEAIHEIRKVVSRLEIEIAMSERDKNSGKPLPIPPHRSSSKVKGAVESILPDEGNTIGNSNGNGGKKDGGSRRPRARRQSQGKQGD